jgi:hypothetical protein
MYNEYMHIYIEYILVYNSIYYTRTSAMVLVIND